MLINHPVYPPSTPRDFREIQLDSCIRNLYRKDSFLKTLSIFSHYSYPERNTNDIRNGVQSISCGYKKGVLRVAKRTKLHIIIIQASSSKHRKSPYKLS